MASRKALISVLILVSMLLPMDSAVGAGKEGKMKSTTELLDVLRKANRLENDVVGEGAPSTRYGAYRDLVKQLDSVDGNQLNELQQNGTPAGKVYAALIQLQKDPAAGRKAFVEFLASKSAIQCQSGCEVFDEQVSSIASDIICTGKLLDFAIITRSGTAAGATAHSASLKPIYWHELLNAEKFADSVAGESGPHPEYLVFKAAGDHVKDLKEADLQELISKAKPAGRVYAAVLLSKKKSSRAPLDKLLADKSTVTYLSGCKGSPSSVGEIAAKLKESGKFYNFSL